MKFETSVRYELDKDLDVHEFIDTSFFNEYLGKLSITFNKVVNVENDYYDITKEPTTCNLIYENKTRGKKFIYDEVTYEKKGFLTIINTQSLKRKCKQKYKSDKMFYELSVFLLNQNLIDHHMEFIKYLNPLTSKPERIYLNKDVKNQYMKPDLEKIANLITNNQISQENITEFGKVLRNYGIANDFEIISPKNLPVSEFRVKIKELFSNIYDVGYGVALQIPMLFEAFIEEKKYGRTFLIEQPEVHLHPKLQAKFIETLLSLGEQNSYIIETHSEYIIRMLQIIIKKKAFNINKDDVRIFYFTRGIEKFEISLNEIDNNGRLLKTFPPGFYDNSYSLTKALMF